MCYVCMCMFMGVLVGAHVCLCAYILVHVKRYPEQVFWPVS